jgi:predicted RNase H-like HicB family nuclease
MTEIIFEVREDDVDGGYTASALGFGIHTEAESVDELRANVREAVDCYFDDDQPSPKLIRLHFVRDEILTR